MTIKLLSENIPYNDLENIINYYNNKLPNEELLELLDRYEGGFKINITSMKNELCDDNQKIKQLRWNNGYLISKNYIGFNKNEEKLLFEAMVHILGINNVLYI
jgi:hypothetical protein